MVIGDINFVAFLVDLQVSFTKFFWYLYLLGVVKVLVLDYSKIASWTSVEILVLIARLTEFKENKGTCSY